MAGLLNMKGWSAQLARISTNFSLLDMAWPGFWAEWRRQASSKTMPKLSALSNSWLLLASGRGERMTPGVLVWSDARSRLGRHPAGIVGPHQGQSLLVGYGNRVVIAPSFNHAKAFMSHRWDQAAWKLILTLGIHWVVGWNMDLIVI